MQKKVSASAFEGFYPYPDIVIDPEAAMVRTDKLLPGQFGSTGHMAGIYSPDGQATLEMIGKEEHLFFKINLMAGILVVILFILSLSGCKDGQKEHKKNNVEITGISESTMMLDGRSFRGWEITNFGPQGPVSVSGDEITLGMGDGCTGITWKGDFPVLDYEVTLEARRIEGNDFFCGMTFPVGENTCTLIVGGWGGTTVGLSNIDGLDASDNNTRILMQFDKNRWYHIRLAVTGTEIMAWIDGLRVVDFIIGSSKLSIRPEVVLSKPFGIASWNTKAALRNIKVTSIQE
jgi:hypothetical protein